MKKTKIISVVIISLLIIFSAFILIKYKSPKNFYLAVCNKFSNTDNTTQVCEEIITTKDHHKVLIDHPKGYMVSLPENFSFDLSLSAEQIKAYSDETTAIITREWSPYLDTWQYIDECLNNYYLDEYYQKENNITIRKNEITKIKGAKAQIISLYRSPKNQSVSRQNEYTYIFVESLTGERAFFRIMLKYKNYDLASEIINEITDSFEEIKIEGTSSFSSDFKPNDNKNWNTETKKYYKSIKSAKKKKWGLFVDGSYTKSENYQWFKDLENKVDYKFDFALHYINLDWDFPVEEMTRFYNDGKITELTLQISNHANDDLKGKNINLSIYDGELDEKIRALAKGAKKFGHPFLFRLNNEMNSDWVNYSGVSTLSDPEIFIENWRRIYNIFDEEGVDNAIWIFNPNAEDCPPAHWNSFVSYFPGNDYVHLIGMTGYNTGTYYAEKYNEKWRTFDEIYKEPYEKYMKVFEKYPFIITEFASSSFGGDKVKWIENMFDSIKNYPNIKMALWWSSADYDMSEEHYKELARPYFLDETEETTNAFKKGIEEYK